MVGGRGYVLISDMFLNPQPVLVLVKENWFDHIAAPSIFTLVSSSLFFLIWLSSYIIDHNTCMYLAKKENLLMMGLLSEVIMTPLLRSSLWCFKDLQYLQSITFLLMFYWMYYNQCVIETCPADTRHNNNVNITPWCCFDVIQWNLSETTTSIIRFITCD